MRPFAMRQSCMGLAQYSAPSQIRSGDLFQLLRHSVGCAASALRRGDTSEDAASEAEPAMNRRRVSLFLDMSD
jgi:hypothetical protein